MALALIVNPSTIDKLEVVSVASALNIQPDVAFARIFRFWAMVADSKDGILIGVTKAHIDGALGFPGFCDSLIKVGWLGERHGNLFIPGFDVYLSEKAIKQQLRKLGTKEKDVKVTIPAELQTPEFMEAWKLWVDYRKEKRKPLTPSTARAQLNQCAEWGADKACVAIQRSVLHGWQGLFKPKGDDDGEPNHVRAGNPIRPNSSVPGDPEKIRKVKERIHYSGQAST